MKRPTGVAGVGWIWDSAAEELGRSGSYCGFRCVAAINVMRPAAAWAAEADPARLQRIADATFWPHAAGGFHMSRDTLGRQRQPYGLRGTARLTANGRRLLNRLRQTHREGVKDGAEAD